MTKETYYAIRIGIPDRHLLYFMKSDGNSAPALFATEDEASGYVRANKKNAEQNHWKVVRVELRELK